MKDHKTILKDAKRRYDLCTTHWSEMQQKNTELLRFASGEQWTYTARQNFENQGFSAITSNRIEGFTRQITNEFRKNTPEVQIDPRNDADKEKAEVLNDLLRNIQEESKAGTAYCEAFESACTTGIGYIRVASKYRDNKSFEQELCIDSINDVNTVMLDPSHKCLVGSDSEFAFISKVMTTEEYMQSFPDSKLAKRKDGREVETIDTKEAEWTASGKRWTEKNQVTIVEYYFKDYKESTLYHIVDSNGNSLYIGDDITPYKDGLKDGGFEIADERVLQVPVVRWTKLNDLEVLEETDWPGCYIPIIALKGKEYWIDGKRKIRGAVEDAVETQVTLNYMLSTRAQLIQMAPKAPYIGTLKQFQGFEQQWANLNVSNQAYIPYNADEKAERPSRDLGEVPIQAASIAIQQAEEDLRSIFGTFDPSQQAQGPESGKALLARQDQSYNSNYHLYDNGKRAIVQVGCICLEAIPVIYDTARTVQVQSEDGKKRSVAINQPDEHGVVEFDMTEGEYSVSPQAGPSFGTRRQEQVEAGLAMVETYPEAAPAVMDLIVRQMDWPGADAIADSLEAMVPPQVLAARKVDPKQAAAMVPGLQAQVQALTQQNALMQQQLHEAAGKMQESADKVQIEHLKAQVDLKKNADETEIKHKQLSLDETRTELEYLIKERELKIAERELDLQAAEVGIKAIGQASDMNADHHDRAVQLHDKHVELTTPSDEDLGEVKDQSSTGMSDSLE